MNWELFGIKGDVEYLALPGPILLGYGHDMHGDGGAWIIEAYTGPIEWEDHLDSFEDLVSLMDFIDDERRKGE